jgi:hypothetical protein
VFDAINKLDARNPNYVMAFDRKGDPYFVRAINAGQDGKVKLIPVPGGGGQAGLFDSNDIIQVKKNDGLFYNFSWKDLENMKGFVSDIQSNPGIDPSLKSRILSLVGSNTEMPRLNINGDTGTLIDGAEATIGTWLQQLVADDQVMELIGQQFGPGWLDSRAVTETGTTNNTAYKSDLTKLFGQYGPQVDWAPVVKKWLAEQGINDNSGKYAELLITGLTSDPRNTPQPEAGTSGAAPGTGNGEVRIVSGDPNFLGQVVRDQRGGRDANTGLPTPGTGAGGPGYGGTPAGSNPASDYLAYTLRNLGNGQTPAPGAGTMANAPELRDSRPPTIGRGPSPTITPKAPPVIPKAPAPKLASAPTSFRTTPTQARFITGGGRYTDRIAL